MAVGGVDNGEMREVLTRRQWAGLVAAVPVAAQVASSPAVPPVGVPSAADGVRKVSEDLAKIEVPMSVEPAFRFQV